MSGPGKSAVKGWIAREYQRKRHTIIENHLDGRNIAVLGGKLGTRLGCSCSGSMGFRSREACTFVEILVLIQTPMAEHEQPAHR
jgi:hypothetical protein